MTSLQPARRGKKFGALFDAVVTETAAADSLTPLFPAAAEEEGTKWNGMNHA